MTAYEDEAHLKQSLAAGVRSFVLKRSATTTLIPAIRAAMTGGTFVDPLLSGRRGGLARRATIADRGSFRHRI